MPTLGRSCIYEDQVFTSVNYPQRFHDQLFFSAWVQNREKLTNPRVHLDATNPKDASRTQIERMNNKNKTLSFTLPHDVLFLHRRRKNLLFLYYLVNAPMEAKRKRNLPLLLLTLVPLFFYPKEQTVFFLLFLSCRIANPCLCSFLGFYS